MLVQSTKGTKLFKIYLFLNKNQVITFLFIYVSYVVNIMLVIFIFLLLTTRLLKK